MKTTTIGQPPLTASALGLGFQAALGECVLSVEDDGFEQAVAAVQPFRNFPPGKSLGRDCAAVRLSAGGRALGWRETSGPGDLHRRN